MSQTYYLYGVPASYYTAKARAFMRKQDLAFEERSSAHPEFGAVVFPACKRRTGPLFRTLTTSSPTSKAPRRSA